MYLFYLGICGSHNYLRNNPLKRHRLSLANQQIIEEAHNYKSIIISLSLLLHSPWKDTLLMQKRAVWTWLLAEQVASGILRCLTLPCAANASALACSPEQMLRGEVLVGAPAETVETALEHPHRRNFNGSKVHRKGRNSEVTVAVTSSNSQRTLHKCLPVPLAAEGKEENKLPVLLTTEKLSVKGLCVALPDCYAAHWCFSLCQMSRRLFCCSSWLRSFRFHLLIYNRLRFQCFKHGFFSWGNHQ